MHIEICQCTPHKSKELDRDKHISRAWSTTISNKLSQSGCNGPRSGIETHPQGLKCWTCGETVDATDCTKFPYYSSDYRNNEKESKGSHQELYSNDQLTSASKAVITYPNEWSKACLMNDKYCVVQFIVDPYGNNRKCTFIPIVIFNLLIKLLPTNPVNHIQKILTTFM